MESSLYQGPSVGDLVVTAVARSGKRTAFLSDHSGWSHLGWHHALNRFMNLSDKPARARLEPR